MAKKTKKAIGLTDSEMRKNIKSMVKKINRIDLDGYTDLEKLHLAISKGLEVIKVERRKESQTLLDRYEVTGQLMNSKSRYKVGKLVCVNKIASALNWVARVVKVEDCDVTLEFIEGNPEFFFKHSDIEILEANFGLYPVKEIKNRK